MNELKLAMFFAVVLVLSNPKLPYVVHSDGSDYVVGASLSQSQDIKKGSQPIF